MKRHLFAACLGLVACAAWTTSAETVVPAEWAKKFNITFSGYSGTEALTDFPALVRFSPETITGFDYADFQSLVDGCPADLAFADADGNQLPYEIDTWNPTGESLVWVKVPSLSSSTKITAYYGQVSALANPDRAKGVWSDYAGVWHMNTDASEKPIVDSTGNGFGGQKYGKTAQIDGPLGKAFANPVESTKNSDGANRILLGDYSEKVSDASTFTVSGWFKHDKANYSNGRRLFCKKENNETTSGFEVYMNATGSNKVHLRGNNKSDYLELDGLKSNVDGELKWFHVMAVYRGNVADVYANGERISAEGGSSLGSGVTATANTFGLGVLNYGNGGAAGMMGAADEVRVSASTFGAAWALAEYETAAKVGFASYGAVELAGEADLPVVAAAVATEITKTGFTANGQVLSLGTASELAVYLDYGTSEDALTEVVLPVQTEVGLVAKTLTDLMPATTYVYRFRGVADGVSVESRFAEVTTLPGEAAFGAATVVPAADALTASVTLTDLAASETGTVVELYVSTDPENWGAARKVFDAVTTLDAATFEATVSPVLLNTAYYVAFKATGLYHGETYVCWSEPVQVTTGGLPTIARLEGVATTEAVTMRAAMDLFGGEVAVALLTGATPEALAETKTWTGLAEASELEWTVDLPEQGYLYYQFVAECRYTDPDLGGEQVLYAETEPKFAGKLTWTGAAGTNDWRTPENWDHGIVPTDHEHLVFIDGGVEAASEARLPFSSNVPSDVTNALVAVSAGDRFLFDHQNWKGSVRYYADRVLNAGYLEIRGGASGGTGCGTEFRNGIENATINAEGAHLRVVSPVTSQRAHNVKYIVSANNRNDGLITIEHGDTNQVQKANNEAYARFALVSPEGGTFTNNGRIILSSYCDAENNGRADFLLGDGKTNSKTFTLSGTGSLTMDMSHRTRNSTNVYEHALMINNNNNCRHILLNDRDHTIQGAGYIKDLALENHGLLRGFDSGSAEPYIWYDETGVETQRIQCVRCPLQVRCYYNAQANHVGARIENMPSGRIIAMESSGGVLLGNGEYASTFFNHGLLEARTGSHILIRNMATESGRGQKSPDADVRFGGVLAGDGTFETFRPITLKGPYERNGVDYPACVVRPGNLALNADGEDDGFGASLPGTLRFTTNVTFMAGATLEINGGLVGGVGKVDGIAVDGAVTIEDGARMLIAGRIPSGTYPLVASSLPIDGDFTLVKAPDSTSVVLSKRSETVGEGAEAVTTYYLDGCFRQGLVLSVR